MDEIKRLNRTLKYEGKILDIYDDLMQMPDGSTEHWDHVAHRKGAAAVLPVLEDGRLVFVRQFRNSIDCDTLEIPAGARENTEEPTAVCAAREMEEEIGYRVGKMELLVHIATTAGFCNEQLDIYLATNLEKTKQHLDAGESLEIETYTEEEACQMVFDGRIIDAKTAAAVLAYTCRENIKCDV